MHYAKTTAIAVAALAVATSASLPASAADVVYVEKPETEPIVVAAGDTATTMGTFALRDQIFYWPFDDAENPLVDVVNGASLAPADITLAVTNESYMSHTTADGAVKRGDGAMQVVKSNAILGLRPVPEALRGDAPFTVMAWFHLGELAASPNNGFFYLGNAANSTNTACARCVLSNSKTWLAVGGQQANSATIDSAESRWIHVAITYTPSSGTSPARIAVNSEGAKSSRDYDDRPEFNQTSAGLSLTSPDDVFAIGGAHYNAYVRHIGVGNAIDDVRIFSRVLTADEIAWFRENTRPADFSAEWRVDAGGALTLPGASDQVVNGYGSVCADGGLKLTPSGDAYFGGTLLGGGLAVAANAATQTIAGAGAYSGKTVLASGTTVFRPKAQLPAALATNLIGHWTFDDPLNPGHDLSGYGNDLFATTNVLFDTIASPVAGGGRALDFSLTGNTTEHFDVRTDSSPNGLVKTNQYGCKVTMAVWELPRVPTGNIRTGIAAFTEGCFFGMSVEGQSYARAITVGGSNAGGATKLTLANNDAGITNTVHFFAMSFDPELMGTAESASAGAFYFDGEKKGNWTIATFTESRWVGRGKFALGKSLYTDTDRNANGIFDQAMLFNRALTAEEIATLHQLGLHGTPATATGALPVGTELEIAAEATGVFENANETVAGLSGSGVLELRASAKLTVTDSFAFRGSAQGAGKLVLGENLCFTPPQQGEGTFGLVTAPAGMIQMPASTAAWTVEGASSSAEISFKLVEDAQSGTETLTVTVARKATCILFR